MLFFIIIFAIIVLLFMIAKSSSNAKTSIRETEKILRTQVEEQDKRLSPKWLAIKAQLELDHHTPSEIEMFFIRWKNGEWAAWEDTAKLHNYFLSESPETRRQIRNVYFKSGDRYDAWEDFFFKNGKNMTHEDIRRKHQEYLMLDDDEYSLADKYELCVNITEYLIYKF